MVHLDLSVSSAPFISELRVEFKDLSREEQELSCTI